MQKLLWTDYFFDLFGFERVSPTDAELLDLALASEPEQEVEVTPADALDSPNE